MKRALSDLNILLSGQLISSRTETLEEYFKDRVNTLGVIGITSAYTSCNISRCTLYERGRKCREFGLASFQVGRMTWYKQPLIAISFFMYFLVIFYAALRLQKKFDYFIGVACFSTFVGVILKKLGVTKKLIYYSIDYYPKPSRSSFATLIIASFRFLDKLCVKYADVTWHISPRIAQGRENFSGVNLDKYRHFTAPLTYDARIKRFVPLENIERYTIGFVGSLSQNQGLQLLIGVMPEIIKQFPKARVRVIGTGPYEVHLKAEVKQAGLEDYFTFHGFIKDESQVLDILSKCALGVAPYTCSEEDNVLYADTGKPKLYAFCGIPIVMTNGMPAAWEIQEKGAGLVIRYDRNDLRDAVISILKDDGKLKKYKQAASEFAKQYTTEKIFDSVVSLSMES